MLEVPVSESDLCLDSEYYRPCQVMALVRLYHYLLDSRPPEDPELRSAAQRVLGPGGWKEESVSKRVDIESALDKLMVTDGEMFEAVLALRDEERQADTAKRLGVSIGTLRTRRDEGIWLMASYLGWDGPCCRDPYMKCPAQGEGVLLVFGE